MALAARNSQTFDRGYSESTRDVMRSLWRVINNDPTQQAAPPDGIDFRELQNTLEMVRESIGVERERVRELQERIAELEPFEAAYASEKRVSAELRADRDCWRGQAMLMAEILPKR